MKKTLLALMTTGALSMAGCYVPLDDEPKTPVPQTQQALELEQLHKEILEDIAKYNRGGAGYKLIKLDAICLEGEIGVEGHVRSVIHEMYRQVAFDIVEDKIFLEEHRGLLKDAREYARAYDINVTGHELLLKDIFEEYKIDIDFEDNK